MTASIAARPGVRRPSVTATTLLMAVLLALGVWGAPQAAAATPTTYQGATYPTAGPSATEDKPQSKLWYTDGAWWALMRVPAGITVHRLESNHTWRNTGTVVDERIASTGDALWQDGKLFVASRVSGGALRAIRLSYDPTTDTYTRDFSQQVAGNGTESMSITRDSLNRLWVAYTQGRRVYVAHTTGSDTAWTAPFLVPVIDNTVASDDIATLVAFNGRVGVMWSDQDNDAIRFAVHADTAADGTWTVENALAGPNLADDHINLKTLTQDSQGRVYAVVKTSRGDAGEPVTDPSIVVLQRTSTGTWTSATASQVGDKLTRAQIVLDTSNDRLYVLMATESGGTVYYKSAPLGALSFPTGKGTPFVQWSGASINDPSTAKHPVTAETGLVVLASDDDAHRYYHGELSLGGTPPPAADTTPPTAPAQVTATPASSSSVGLSWAAATDDVGVTGYRITRNGAQVGTTAGTTYTDTGLAASTSYTYTVTAVDAAGNVSPASAPVTATTPAGQTTPPPSGAGFVSATTATGAGTSTAVPSPAGVQAGDVLVAAVSVRGTPTITAPAGWTLVRTDANGTTMRQSVYVRALTGTDGSSTWTLSQAKDTVIQVVAYRGVDTASPVVGSAGAISTTATVTSPAAPAVAGARVVTFAGIARTTTLAPAAPLTERTEITTAGTATYKVTANSADTTSTGTTAGPFSTTANGSAGGVGQTVTLRPLA